MWEQETTQDPGRGGNRDRGARKRDITSGTRTHTKEGHTTTERPVPPTPSGRHTTPGDARPQHMPPKRESDAIRITPAHAHQPPETSQGREGTPAQEERATPTEEATENTAAQPTTTPSPPGNDPGHHKDHVTRRHRKRTNARPQRPGLGTGTPRGHGSTAQAPREGNPTDTNPTHRPERHTQTPTERTQRATHI